MTSTIIRAAKEFAKDESGRKRTRWGLEDRNDLIFALEIFEKSGQSRLAPDLSAARGRQLLGAFDVFVEAPPSEVAADLIADLLWAVRSLGGDPEEVLKEALLGYQEENREPGVDPLTLTVEEGTDGR